MQCDFGYIIRPMENKAASRRFKERDADLNELNAELKELNDQSQRWFRLVVKIGLPYLGIWIAVNAYSVAKPEDLPLSAGVRVASAIPLAVFGYAAVRAQSLTNKGKELLTSYNEKYWPGRK